MYSQPDYKDRLNLPSICNYLRYGTDDSTYLEDSSLEEREKRINKAMITSLHVFRDRVIAFDWSSVGENEFERTTKNEEMSIEISDAISELTAFEYEMGFRAAISIYNSRQE